MEGISGSIKVFLVEDSALIRERLIEGFASAAIDIVGYADTESQAMTQLDGAPCDAVVLDLELRQGNGLRVLQWIRSRRGGQPLVIVFTNYVYPYYRAQSMQFGADHFFDKAQDFDRVRETIEALAPTDRADAR